MTTISLHDLLTEIRQCKICETDLPLGTNPVLRAESSARILIVGQAPGTRVHESGIPWNDPSGDRLRYWMGLDKTLFYDARKIAIVPMGFCYPGKGKSGDLPPRPECAPRWHEEVLSMLPNIELTLLIGNYAQNYYLDKRHKTLTERVVSWRDYEPDFIPLVHPSPRNTYWLQQNPWFEQELVPAMQKRLAKLIK